MTSRNSKESISNNNMDFKYRRQGRPVASVEQTDIESDSIFPHIPLSATWDPGRPEAAAGESSIRGDLGSIMLLMFLYILQGIPLGLAGSIPMLLQSRKVSYTDQAVFSFVSWPFSIKLLWAPLVDSIYVSWFGRRKTWLIPIQYLMGLFMLILSTKVKELLGGDPGQGSTDEVHIFTLTAIFFCLNFLAATQDIAVDGWALTMLSRRNIGWASTCNTVGQTAGYFLGNILFLALESADFCNNYLRSVPQAEGIVTLSGFLWFMGCMFLLTTTLVGIFKREHMDLDVDPEQGILETYKILLNVIRLPAIVSYVIILMTSKITFAATDALTGLKLIEAGMPKERLALFAVPVVPVQVLLPLVISKYTSGPRPLDIWLKAYPFRMLVGVLYCLIVYWASVAQTVPGEFPWYFYMVVLLLYCLHQAAVYCMFVPGMAFHAKVSDPSIGGTYMTLLNTVTNLGGNWPSTLALSIVDHLTWKDCSVGGSCHSKDLLKVCTDSGGVCGVSVDGYYIMTVVCTVFGLLWLKSRAKHVRNLGELSEKSWKYHSTHSS